MLRKDVHLSLSVTSNVVEWMMVPERRSDANRFSSQYVNFSSHVFLSNLSFSSLFSLAFFSTFRPSLQL